MFATAIPKRLRDEDGEEMNGRAIESTTSKKPRTLPFRTSPTTKHTILLFSRNRQLSLPPALTPADSSDDDSEGSPAILIRSVSTANSPSIMNIDSPNGDDHMSDSQQYESPIWSPARQMSPCSLPPIRPAYFPDLQPSKPLAKADHLTITNPNIRIPTPIYGHFNLASPDTTANTAGLSAFPNVLPKPVLTAFQDTPKDLFLRSRRLPSPICEDENMESPTSMTGTMMQNLHMNASPRQPSSLLSAQVGVDAVTPPPPMMAVPTVAVPHTEPLPTEVSMIDPDDHSGWRHRRRGAIDGGIKGEGGKVVFAMGYRSDCEKCRERVPGHYSHILRA